MERYKFIIVYLSPSNVRISTHMLPWRGYW